MNLILLLSIFHLTFARRSEISFHNIVEHRGNYSNSHDLLTSDNIPSTTDKSRESLYFRRCYPAREKIAHR